MRSIEPCEDPGFSLNKFDIRAVKEKDGFIKHEERAVRCGSNLPSRCRVDILLKMCIAVTVNLIGACISLQNG